MNISKHKDEYVVEKDGGQLAKIRTYRNPYHMINCYIDFDADDSVGIGETNIFQIIANEEKSPLQAILSSLETQKAIILASQGFKKVRICHEMDVRKSDLLSALPSRVNKISKAYRGQGEYEGCCGLLFEYYKNTHEAINPLTSTFEAFIKNLPAEVFYAGGIDGIQHVAFVEDHEIAYLGSEDQKTFAGFALALVNELFAANQSIVFEADNVDWAAMAVKNLFLTDSTETFDTWIYKI